MVLLTQVDHMPLETRFMRLSNGGRRQRTINLTPLIDIVFLLLVFFMLATTFVRFGTVKIETAGAGSGTVELSKTVLIHVAGAGKFRVNGAEVLQSELAQQLDQLVLAGRTSAVIVLRKNALVGDLVNAVAEVRQRAFKSVRVVN